MNQVIVCLMRYTYSVYKPIISDSFNNHPHVIMQSAHALLPMRREKAHTGAYSLIECLQANNY